MSLASLASLFLVNMEADMSGVQPASHTSTENNIWVLFHTHTHTHTFGFLIWLSFCPVFLSTLVFLHNFTLFIHATLAVQAASSAYINMAAEMKCEADTETDKEGRISKRVLGTSLAAVHSVPRLTAWLVETFHNPV